MGWYQGTISPAPIALATSSALGRGIRLLVAITVERYRERGRTIAFFFGKSIATRRTGSVGVPTGAAAQPRSGTMATFILSGLMLVRIAVSASARPNSWLTISANG